MLVAVPDRKAPVMTAKASAPVSNAMIGSVPPERILRRSIGGPLEATDGSKRKRPTLLLSTQLQPGD